MSQVAHRAGESGSYTRLRHGMDPTLKKLLFALLALLISVVGVLVGYDRQGIKGAADRGLQNSIKNGAEIGIVKNDMVHVKAEIDELKIGQRRIVEGQQKIIDTLYTLPAERRRSARPVLEAPE